MFFFFLCWQKYYGVGSNIFIRKYCCFIKRLYFQLTPLFYVPRSNNKSNSCAGPEEPPPSYITTIARWELGGKTQPELPLTELFIIWQQQFFQSPPGLPPTEGPPQSSSHIQQSQGTLPVWRDFLPQHLPRTGGWAGWPGWAGGGTGSPELSWAALGTQ